MTAAAVVEQRLEGAHEIPLAELRPAPWNARKSFDDGALAELAASIKEHGVLVRLLVRPLEAMADILQHPEAAAKSARGYEIIAGHRRLKAAELVGLKTLPCEVREISDDEARELSLVDNVQRVDVSAMEQAVAFAELLTRLGSIEAVALRVQKEQGYVAKRLKLCSLSLAAQDALRERLITIDHALLLARLGANEQDKALKWCLQPSAGVKTSVDQVIDECKATRAEEAKKDNKGSWIYRSSWEPQSVISLKDRIASTSGILLSRAPWNLDSADVIPEGEGYVAACNVCPQNTRANAPLFGDLEIGEAMCTDGACFREKTEAFVQIALKDAEGKRDLDSKVEGKHVLRVSWKLSTAAPRMLKDDAGVNPAQTFRAGQWVEAKPKNCPNVRAAVTVDWSDAGDRGYMGVDRKLRKPGEILQVCVEPKCKAHPKEYMRPKRSNGAQRDEAAEKEREEKLRQAAIAENKLRVATASAAIEGVTSLPIEAVRKLALDALPDWAPDLKSYEAVVPGIKKVLGTAKADSVEFARAVAAASINRNDLHIWERGDPKDQRGTFIASLKVLGYDASKAWLKPKAEKQAGQQVSKSAGQRTKKAAKKLAKKTTKKGGAK